MYCIISKLLHWINGFHQNTICALLIHSEIIVRVECYENDKQIYFIETNASNSLTKNGATRAPHESMNKLIRMSIAVVHAL